GLEAEVEAEAVEVGEGALDRLLLGGRGGRAVDHHAPFAAGLVDQRGDLGGERTAAGGRRPAARGGGGRGLRARRGTRRGAAAGHEEQRRYHDADGLDHLALLTDAPVRRGRRPYRLAAMLRQPAQAVKGTGCAVAHEAAALARGTMNASPRVRKSPTTSTKRSGRSHWMACAAP